MQKYYLALGDDIMVEESLQNYLAGFASVFFPFLQILCPLYSIQVQITFVHMNPFVDPNLYHLISFLDM